MAIKNRKIDNDLSQLISKLNLTNEGMINLERIYTPRGRPTKYKVLYRGIEVGSWASGKNSSDEISQSIAKVDKLNVIAKKYNCSICIRSLGSGFIISGSGSKFHITIHQYDESEQYSFTMNGHTFGEFTEFLNSLIAANIVIKELKEIVQGWKNESRT